MTSSAQTQAPKVQAPVQLKEGVKKAKTDVKPVPFIITDDLKEPEEGLTLPANFSTPHGAASLK